MKHCRNCKYCSLDMVSQYIKGVDIYTCDIDKRIISEPFWEKCEKYEKENYNVGGLLKWIGDCVSNGRI